MLDVVFNFFGVSVSVLVAGAALAGLCAILVLRPSARLIPFNAEISIVMAFALGVAGAWPLATHRGATGERRKAVLAVLNAEIAAKEAKDKALDAMNAIATKALIASRKEREKAEQRADELARVVSELQDEQAMSDPFPATTQKDKPHATCPNPYRLPADPRILRNIRANSG